MRNCSARAPTPADRIGDRNSATRPIRGYGSLALLLNFPDHDGFSVLAELRRHYPNISVVLLPARQYCATIAKALGLRACVPGSDDSDVISAAQLMADGAIDVPAEIISRDNPRFVELSAHRPFPSRPRISPTDVGLTRRQLDVLAQLMDGKSNKAICRILNVAEPTVKNHVTAILKALKVTNRTEAVLAAKELKWDLPLIR